METEKTSKQKVAKMQLNDTKPQQKVEKQKREVVVPWMRNVVFCTPEWFIAPDKDVVKALSGASHLDERQVRKIMNGNVDFKISSIDRIADGLDLVYILVPVVKSSGLRRKIAYFGKMVGHIWQIPSKKITTAMPYLFREFSAIKDISTEAYTAIYELVQVVSGAIRGGGKDGKLIEILRRCTKEIANLVHEEAEG
jgi:hypothetical protein